MDWGCSCTPTADGFRFSVFGFRFSVFGFEGRYSPAYTEGVLKSQVSNLKDNMPHVVTVAPQPFLACDGRLRVHCIPAATDNLCWVAECTQTGEAVVIDGPPDPEMLDAVRALDNTLVAVWNTHTHPDHIGVNRLLAERGELDALPVFGPAAAKAAIPGLTDPVDEGSAVTVGAVNAQVWRTDGHQDGHVTYVFDDVIFCGDVLFAGGCGYLFDGPPEAMFASLMRLASLPGDTRVCCAHEYTLDNLAFARWVEPFNAELQARQADVIERRQRGECVVPSTIAMEQATNPFLRPGSPDLQQTLVGFGALGDATVSHADVFAAARAAKNKGPHKSA